MKPLQNKRIGLVLPSVPGYSETFFRSKIKGLQEHGAIIIVFAGNSSVHNETLCCSTVTAPNLSGNKLKVVFRSLMILLKAFLLNNRVSRRYLKLEKKEGTALFTRIKKLIANHYILSKSLDWLHFGFGTMALERENAAEAMGAKMAVSFRGFDHYVYPLKNPNCYEKMFSKKIKYHVLSQGMKTSLLQAGISENLINKITPAIDLSLFHNTGKINNTLQIITIARLHWIKGIEYTLEALAILNKQGFDFQYTIVGDGPDRERLVFAAYQLGLEKKVTFAGKLAPKEVQKQLAHADVYVQYSIQEGFCNAVLEAQAMGLLCVVSDAEGLSENVLHKQTGWVVPKRKPKLLAEKIEQILALNPEQKRQITENAVNRVKEEFNIEKQIAAFVDFYN